MVSFESIRQLFINASIQFRNSSILINLISYIYSLFTYQSTKADPPRISFRRVRGRRWRGRQHWVSIDHQVGMCFPLGKYGLPRIEFCRRGAERRNVWAIRLMIVYQLAGSGATLVFAWYAVLNHYCHMRILFMRFCDRRSKICLCEGVARGRRNSWLWSIDGWWPQWSGVSRWNVIEIVLRASY